VSVREMVTAARLEMRDSDKLTPGQVRELLARLTSLIGNVNAEARHADMAYNVVLDNLRTELGSAAAARIKADTTEEYLRAREAEDTKEEVLESVRSLKKWLESLDNEMRLSR
jgi:hypothetical protein